MMVIEKKKMSKKAQKELNKKDRVFFQMNTGSRDMDKGSPDNPHRYSRKEKHKKQLNLAD